MPFATVRRLSQASLQALGLRRSNSDGDRHQRRGRSNHNNIGNENENGNENGNGNGNGNGSSSRSRSNRNSNSNSNSNSNRGSNSNNYSNSNSNSDRRHSLIRGPALLPNSTPTTPPETTLGEKLSRATADNMDGLLAIETQIRVEDQYRRASHPGSFRPTKVTFNLPKRPLRPIPGFVLRINSGTKEKDKASDITVGSDVRLVLRPVLTLGRVRYMEPHSIPNHPERLVGVELTDGVGDCDGCLEGIRYFQTKNLRAVFVPLSNLALA
ncbi:hypothetical protein J3Q64DRAFT_1725635 [Phycomyces blakesleeanus]|uniref:CAP-Gly domain-containing protein n=1 Tax=Phycomyces blakesleeanus TaxID=4837 RepID=A0ABR3B7L7_PHYBL